MPNLKIEPTDRSPAIDFDFENGTLSIKGESYPEDASAFYGPILKQLENYLASLNAGAIKVVFELIYFNSSSTKVLMELFDRFDEVAGKGINVEIDWRVDEDDDTMEEFGEEFGEDLEHAKFKLVKISI